MAATTLIHTPTADESLDPRVRINDGPNGRGSQLTFERGSSTLTLCFGSDDDIEQFADAVMEQVQTYLAKRGHRSGCHCNACNPEGLDREALGVAPHTGMWSALSPVEFGYEKPARGNGTTMPWETSDRKCECRNCKGVFYGAPVTYNGWGEFCSSQCLEEYRFAEDGYCFHSKLMTESCAQCERERAATA